MSDFDDLPEVKDGLSKKERVVLYCLHELQKERGDKNVPSVMLYGRVVEQINISPDEFQRILARMIGN